MPPVHSVRRSLVAPGARLLDKRRRWGAGGHISNPARATWDRRFCLCSTVFVPPSSPHLAATHVCVCGLLFTTNKSRLSDESDALLIEPLDSDLVFRRRRPVE